jgi:hypothetical protein
LHLEQTIGGPYVRWAGGPFARRAPAWIGGHPAPDPATVRYEGAFCGATAFTLPLRVLGLPFPDPTDPRWEGGLLDYGQDFIHEQQIAVPYKIQDLRILDALMTEYTDEALEDQGHVWLKWKGDKCFGADLPCGITTSEKERDPVRQQQDSIRRSGPYCRIILSDTGGPARIATTLGGYMKRTIAMLSVMVVMVAMLAMPAFAFSNQTPHTCVDLGGGTLCQHRVSTPSGNSNGQDQFRGDLFDHEGGADVGGEVVSGEYVSHSTIAPSGSFNSMFRQGLDQ